LEGKAGGVGGRRGKGHGGGRGFSRLVEGDGDANCWLVGKMGRQTDWLVK